MKVNKNSWHYKVVKAIFYNEEANVKNSVRNICSYIGFLTLGVVSTLCLPVTVLSFIGVLNLSAVENILISTILIAASILGMFPLVILLGRSFWHLWESTITNKVPVSFKKSIPMYVGLLIVAWVGTYGRVNPRGFFDGLVLIPVTAAGMISVAFTVIQVLCVIEKKFQKWCVKIDWEDNVTGK